MFTFISMFEPYDERQIYHHLEFRTWEWEFKSF